MEALLIFIAFLLLYFEWYFVQSTGRIEAELKEVNNTLKQVKHLLDKK